MNKIYSNKFVILFIHPVVRATSFIQFGFHEEIKIKYRIQNTMNIFHVYCHLKLALQVSFAFFSSKERFRIFLIQLKHYDDYI